MIAWELSKSMPGVFVQSIALLLALAGQAGQAGAVAAGAPPRVPPALANVSFPFAYIQSAFVTGHHLGVPCRKFHVYVFTHGMQGARCSVGTVEVERLHGTSFTAACSRAA